MNIYDKLREWQNTRDGGGAGDLRRALGETLEQIRQAVASEPAPEGKPDPTAAHYLEVCATVDAIKGTVEEHRKAKRLRVDRKVLEQLLGMEQ